MESGDVVHFFLRDWLGLQCGQSPISKKIVRERERRSKALRRVGEIDRGANAIEFDCRAGTRRRRLFASLSEFKLKA